MYLYWLKGAKILSYDHSLQRNSDWEATTIVSNPQQTYRSVNMAKISLILAVFVAMAIVSSNFAPGK